MSAGRANLAKAGRGYRLPLTTVQRVFNTTLINIPRVVVEVDCDEPILGTCRFDFIAALFPLHAFWKPHPMVTELRERIAAAKAQG